MPERPQRLLYRTWLRRAIPAGVVTALVVGGIAVVRANAGANPTDSYRTTTATTGSVEQRLDLTGSVQRVNQVSQTFAVNGTVASVWVAVGDSVRAGQALATLAPQPLRSAVTAARADLAKAKAALESDQAATTAATSTEGAKSVTPASAPASPSVTTSSGRSGVGVDPSLARAQRGLTTAQSAITADLHRAAAVLRLCAPFFPSGQSPTTPSGSSTSFPTAAPSAGGPSPGTTATTTPSEAAIRACVGALRTAPTPQQSQQHQKGLTRSQAQLAAAVNRAITTARQPAGQSATSQSATSQSATSQSSGGRTGGTGQSSADRLTSDQGAVTSAEAGLSTAQTDLASATLRSPIAGTVGSVDLKNGAASQGKRVVIVGAGAVEVTVNVPLASMSTVHVGQEAQVTPLGATGSVPGEVTSIGLLPSAAAAGNGPASGTAQTTATASASDPVYPVVVLVRQVLPALLSGSRAQVSLLIGTAGDVLIVPNSALTPLGNGQALAVRLKDGVATRTLVGTGYAGTLTTQITSGLTKGQQVVLADLGTALPTNSTNARRFGVGGGAASGIGGAGIGGAGIGGATGGANGGATTGRTGLTPRG